MEIIVKRVVIFENNSPKSENNTGFFKIAGKFIHKGRIFKIVRSNMPFIFNFNKKILHKITLKSGK